MNDAKNVDDYRWLTSESGCAAVASALGDARPLHALVSELRKDLSIERTHLVLEQCELRRRAEKKFDRAREMFFTKCGLEQATDQWIAAYKASRFSHAMRVADLCCGSGGDLLALAARGPVTGIECDPCVAVLARANLRLVADACSTLPHNSSTTAPARSSKWQILVTRAEEFDVASVDAWHGDPDRRPSGRRTTRIELHAPNERELGRLLAKNPHAAIKLSPASDPPSDWASQTPVEWEWVTRDRECRQLIAWCGELARNRNQHVATIVYSDGRAPHSFAGLPGEPVAICPTVDRFVLVPDPALFAARLDGALASHHRLRRLGEPGSRPSGYLTGSTPIDEPLCESFEVLDVLALDTKRIAATLRAGKIGILEIKLRGLELDPHRFRKRLGLRGDGAATLLATVIGKKAVAILAQRHPAR